MRSVDTQPAAGTRERGSRLLAGPWGVGALVAVAAGLAALPMLIPGLAERWEFSGSAVASGELWRLFTSHWTHWSVNHLAWDLAMLLPLLALAWHWGRRRTVTLLAASSIAICAAVAWAMPDLASYRGLSGIDSALFVHVALTAWRRFDRVGDRQGSGIAKLALGLFLGKVLMETVTGSALFVDADGYVPVPLAHLVGGVTALILQPWCAWSPASSSVEDSSPSLDLTLNGPRPLSSKSSRASARRGVLSG